MTIHALIEALENQCGGVCLSDVCPGPQDIDIVLEPKVMDLADRLLKAHGFVVDSASDFQRLYLGFIDGCGYILDLTFNFELYSRYSVGLTLSLTGQAELIKQPKLYKALKYICQRRWDKLDAIKKEHAAICAFLREPSNVEWLSLPMLAALDSTPDELLHAIHRPYALTKFLPRYFRSRIVTRIGEILRRRRLGSVVALIGPDGSGKSFLIERLRQVGLRDVQYMGDWFFRLQPFYNACMRIPSPFNRFVYVFYLLENWLRYLSVWLRRFRGRTVLLDRFPGTNRNAAHTGMLGKINRLTYWLFPKPDLIVLLMADPQVIYARKQELSPQQIAQLQVCLRDAIATDRHALLNTENADVALNGLLTLILQHTRQAVVDGKGRISKHARLLMRLRSRTLLALAATLRLSSLLVPKFRTDVSGKTRILVMHHLDDRQRFRAIVRTLCRHYNLISFDQYKNNIGIDPNRLNLILAFDDGYRSWHTVGLPVFREFDVRPLLFINTDFVGLSDPAAFDYAAEKISTWPEGSLNWNELRDLQEAGAEICAHGSGHEDMSSTVDPDTLDQVVQPERFVLHTQLGAPPRAFAYPFGRYNEASVEALRRAGYEYGFSTRSGFLGESMDEFTLPRSNVGMRSPRVVCAVAEGYADRVSSMVAWLRRRGRRRGGIA
jgi:peptidoglycan/xylan/chitin deacetylase (PgdA/CDA1 family)/thymidylate kinase